MPLQHSGQGGVAQLQARKAEGFVGLFLCITNLKMLCCALANAIGKNQRLGTAESPASGLMMPFATKAQGQSAAESSRQGCKIVKTGKSVALAAAEKGQGASALSGFQMVKPFGGLGQAPHAAKRKRANSREAAIGLATAAQCRFSRPRTPSLKTNSQTAVAYACGGFSQASLLPSTAYASAHFRIYTPNVL